MSREFLTRHLNIFGLSALCLCVPRQLAAQQISIGPTVTISSDAPADPYGESFLAVNPKNSKNQLVTSCRIGKDGMGSAAYVTHDSGLTWSRVHLPEAAH